jgi:diguanylate cyclase (GGDEF)-like protein
MRYVLKLSYDGTRYAGWQRQKNALSVQEALEDGMARALGGKYSVTASVGAAVFPGDGKSFEELYKAADNALYVSKRHGKNQLSFYKKPENETK